MDTEPNSPPRDGGGDSPAAFRKLSSDGSGRKYRRRALADDGSSSSDGSPEHNQSPNRKHSEGDSRKVSESGYVRKDDRRESDNSRYDRGGNSGSYRYDRYSRDEYNRHESRDSRVDHRSDRRKGESGRSRHDSDRHSRDKYRSSGNEKSEDLSSDRRHVDSRFDDKEKRGSRRGFGERHSRDERKKHEYTEIDREKDVHVKSPRNRSDEKCLAADDRDNHSKKLKGFVSEKFTTTHGNTDEEKQTSSLKPVPVAGDVDAAKVAAMQAAELVNKNLVGTGYLTTDQKKKLLWGKKKSTATEEPAHRWDSALVGDPERQEKFNKLMGVKGGSVVSNQEQNPSEVQAEKQKELQMDLEKQYTAGLRRRDGRTVGLGL